MQKRTITSFVSVLLALAAQGFAQKTETPTIKPGYELGDRQMAAAYNAPARIDLKNSWDFFLNASFIYWQPQEGSLEVAEYYVTGRGEHKLMSLDFHPGFKVGLGLNSGFDDWDSSIEYVRLHTRDVNHFNKPSWGSLNDPFLDEHMSSSSMSATLKLNYDMLECLLGRYFYNGKNLTLRPNIGIKGGWINQHLNTSAVNYGDPTITPWSKIKWTSWLAGPRFGINSKWIWGNGLRLFGDVDISLLYQSLKCKYSMRETGSVHHYSIDPNRITPNLGAILGIGWGSYFCNQKYNFDLSAGYEFQYYFHQNMSFITFHFPSTSTPTATDDLMLQGLTVKAQFDF